MIPRNLLFPALAALLAAAPLSAQSDTTPPSVPVNLAGTAASSTTAVLYWTQANDDTAVTAYDIYRDGTLLLTHPDNTYRDTGLSPGSTHTYRVAARDGAGHVSDLSTAFAVTTDATENPRLVRPEHLTYLGAFVPPYDASNDYSYGGTAITFNPAHNSLFIGGNAQNQLVGEISIPTPVITTDYFALPIAAVLQNLTDLTEGHRDEVGPDGIVLGNCRVGGLLLYGGSLLGTSYLYFDAGGDARRSHFTSSLNLAQTGDFSGMYTVGTYNSGFVAGYMAHIPPEWQSALGGPVLTGQNGLAIISRTSFGPSATVFDPAQLGVADPVPGRLVVGYTGEHSTLGTWGNQTELNPQFNQASGSSGLVFPPGSDSVLFFGSSGVGVPHYGQGTSDPALHLQPVNDEVIYVYDPANGSKGNHSYPYVAYVWAYRAQDLARVAAGEIQPWQAVPYATWELPLPIGPAGSQFVSGAAYDPATNRLFVARGGEYLAAPVIHIFQLALSAPPATYATWRAANFTGTDLSNDALSGPLADPDAAGVTNFQRYAFALPARGPVANPVTLGTTTSAGASYLTLNFPRRAVASDLSYVVDSSPDLVIWTPVPGRTYTAGAGPITAEDIVALADPATTRRFLRLRVTQP